MKLSEAIQFATDHKTFIDFLSEGKIDPGSANGISARITNETDSTIEHSIFIDFGRQGSSSNDTRIIIDYDKTKDEFIFIQIDHPKR